MNNDFVDSGPDSFPLGLSQESQQLSEWLALTKVCQTEGTHHQQEMQELLRMAEKIPKARKASLLLANSALALGFKWSSPHIRHRVLTQECRGG